MSHLFLKKAPTAGKGIGWFIGSCVRYRRKEVTAVLHDCFPEKSEKEIKDIISGMYRHFGANIAEWSMLNSVDLPFVRENIEIENEHLFYDTLAAGNGVIVLTAHTGNFIFLCITAGLLKIPLHVITKRIRPEWLNRRWDAVFNKLNVKTLPRRNSYRDCRKVLKNKEALGFILDQNMKRREGIFVDFFGKPACTSPGLAFLSANCKSPVLPVFAFRKNNGKHKIVVMQPLDPPPDRKPETLLAATQHYTAIIEDFIREHPEQWIWIHRRWRTRPE